jgi:hypothetical protein
LGLRAAVHLPRRQAAELPAAHRELEANDNPFATVVLAHLAAQDTRGDMERRQQIKGALTRRLYERGYSKAQVLPLYRFIDWLLELPAERETQLWQEIQAYEEERQMPYITSVERMGRERGLLEGREQAKREVQRRIIQTRFQAVPPALEQRIATAGAAELDRMIDRALLSERVDDL